MASTAQDLQFLDLDEDSMSHILWFVGFGTRDMRNLKLSCKKVHKVWEETLKHAQEEVQAAANVLCSGDKEKYTHSIAVIDKWADKNIPSACFELGCLLVNPLGGLKRDAKRGKELLTKAVRAGHKLAIVRCYEEGIGVDVNHQRAWQVLQTLPESDPRVQCLLGWFYLLGLCVDPEPDRARDFYRRAAEAGFPRGMYNYGTLIYQSSPAEALQWFERAAQYDDAASIHAIGWMHKNGFGVPESHEKAVEYFRRAAALNHGLALTHLAIAHREGLGVPVNVTDANKLFRLAAEQDDPYAKKLLEDGEI